MKTKKLYLCKIGEVKEISDSLFVGVKKVLYFYHERLRLAKLKVDKLTGRRKYELVISGEELDVGYERVKCVGDLFVAEASNLLMMLETPTTIKKTMSRKELLKLEWVLNELTQKDLRKAHNIVKLYHNGALDIRPKWREYDDED